MLNQVLVPALQNIKRLNICQRFFQLYEFHTNTPIVAQTIKIVNTTNVEIILSARFSIVYLLAQMTAELQIIYDK